MCKELIGGHYADYVNPWGAITDILEEQTSLFFKESVKYKQINLPGITNSTPLSNGLDSILENVNLDIFFKKMFSLDQL